MEFATPSLSTEAVIFRRVGVAQAATAGRAEMGRPPSFPEATCFCRGRSGASRDIVAAGCGAFLIQIKIKIKIKPKASATKAAGYFLLSKATKKGNQRKMLLFESRARAFDADAGIFHTGPPCPDEKRPASLRAALRVFDGLR
ncbi:hypothetical protein [Lysobacter sp. 1R34A]|uniref:hypothetical protein n=1 Tax=Lysobacter sp. 1R34A TaxID=3445786 RepID=UPI003EE8E2CD